MKNMDDLQDFLEPVNAADLNDDVSFNDGQLGANIKIYENDLPDLEDANLVIVGINEQRGDGVNTVLHAPDEIRRHFYQLYYWHTDVKIADIGNIRTGATITDTYAAVKTVVRELLGMKKTIILLGGSHDITLAQYSAYKDREQLIEATGIDATIDLRSESAVRSENFLMEMLTGEPNMVKHYNHIGFQSFFVHPRMLETMDKLRFDCYRVGVVKDNIEEMEPVLRNTDLLTIDIAALKYSDAPSGNCSPNGLTGEEACTLSRYAGMSPVLSSMGIFGYRPELDEKGLTAKQIAQMLWYFIDGKSRSRQEALFEEKNSFNEYHTAFTEMDTVFLQSKKTGRWWMQLPDKKLIACSYNDYVNASNNQIPERWLRAQERT